MKHTWKVERKNSTLFSFLIFFSRLLASNSHHGEMHGEKTGQKMTEHCPPYLKSLTNVGTHLGARHPASDVMMVRYMEKELDRRQQRTVHPIPTPPPTPSKSLTNVGTHLVVARNPAGNSHHGQIHGERIRRKAIENCLPHPYPPLPTSLWQMRDPPCCCKNTQPATATMVKYITWRRNWALDGRKLFPPSISSSPPTPSPTSLWQTWVPTLLPETQPATATMVRYMEKELDGRQQRTVHPSPTTTTTNKSLTAVGTHLVVAGNPASDSHHGQIHEKELGKRQQRTAHPIATPYRQQVFDSHGYPPCNRKPSQWQPPWSDTRRRNKMEGNRELSAPSLPPTTNKSLTNVTILVTRNPASDSHDGEIHGEGIGQKTAENCPPHPYHPPPTSLWQTWPSLLPETQPATATMVRYMEKELGRRQRRTVHHIPTTHPQQIFDNCGYPPCCCQNPSRQQPPWSDTWRKN